MTAQVSPREVIAGASAALKSRHEEVNKLNVFPVPDGDTGTNMSLTLESVATEVLALPADAPLEEIAKAATHGSLMGARGNSGVILSQIIRGVCEGVVASAGEEPAERLAQSLEHAKTVAYQAVRKPVEGTILTVVSDMAICARKAADAQQSFDDALEAVSAGAHTSVQRTPDLLPILKESGVVDSGGFGLAIIFDAVANILLGREQAEVPVFVPQGVLTVNPIDDWDDDEYLYCTEFLLFGDNVDREALHDYIATQGGSELVVGDYGQYKIHVHTNDPSKVLAQALSHGEVAEVHIHNMRRQQAARGHEHAHAATPVARKKIGVIAVSAGEGTGNILKSLGVDALVSGGQTMNPSTQDFVEAARTIPAESYILLPNNSNIILAANTAATLIEEPTIVVPTTSVPEAFSALLAFEEALDLDTLLHEMSEAASEVTTAEVTTAIKDAKSAVGDIREGDIIGIIGSKDIRVKGSSIPEVACALLETLPLEGVDTVTLLTGADLSPTDLYRLREMLQASHPELEYDTQEGGQPLYPLIMAVE